MNDIKPAGGGRPPPEKGPPEKGPPEKGPPEKGPPEKGPPEKGPPEKGPPEKGPPEKGPPEKGPPERGAAQAVGPEAAAIGIGMTSGPDHAGDAMHGDPATSDPSLEESALWDRIAGTQGAGRAADGQVVATDSLVDTPVYGMENEVLGRVRQVLVDFVEGRVAYMVVRLTDVAGGHLCAIPWTAFEAAPTQRLSIPRTADDLRQAPTFDWPLLGDPEWLEDVHLFFECPPYWIP